MEFGAVWRQQVDLAVYVEERNIGKVHWAMRSLQQAMKCASPLPFLNVQSGALHMPIALAVTAPGICWDLTDVQAPLRVLRRHERRQIAFCRWDEETWGLEYDLDLFNIVAVR